MKGHGATITGTAVEDATTRAIKLENLAQITWDVTRAGPVPEISEADLAEFNARGGMGSRGDRSYTTPVWDYYVDLLRHEGLSEGLSMKE